MNETKHMDLKNFCSRHHSDMKTPMRYGTRVVATNGHILVMTTGTGEEYQDAPTRVANVISEMENGNYSGVVYPIADIDLPDAINCRLCGGKGHIYKVRCPDCDGEGEFYYGRHWYTCHECDGEGKSTPAEETDDAEKEPCYHCDGSGEDFQSVRVGDLHFQRRYLSLLKTLPDCFLEPGGTINDAARFRFDGGVGFLMPCRP